MPSSGLNGWLIVDKGREITSADVVADLRRYFGQKKVGHAGTLDPLATGVLPVAFGKATKTIQYVMQGAKTYQFTLRFGESRSSDDAEGEITARSSVVPTEEQARAVLPKFIGEIRQAPPAFSALRVNGRRAYDLARRGELTELPPRLVRIEALRLIGREDERDFRFEATTGKGVYIRSLGRDIARACGGLGYIAALRRTRCGPFSLEGSHPSRLFGRGKKNLDNSPQTGQKTSVSPSDLLPAHMALADIPALYLEREEGKSLIQGKKLPWADSARQTPLSGIRQIWTDNHFLGLGMIGENGLRALKMFESHHFFGENNHDVDYL